MLTFLLAHAAPISYRFPLPVWAYALSAGAVVLLSAPAAALAVGRREERTGSPRNLYPALRRLRLGAIGLALASVLLAFCLVGGAAAALNTGEEVREFFENPATVLIWVDFWVGLGLVSALVGNVWDFVSPLNAAARALDRRRAAPRRQYPAWLGQWPAVAMLLVWSWLELVSLDAKEPQKLVAALLLYCLLTLVASALWGAESWLANGEMFTVLARTFARCAPLQLEPASPDAWLRARPQERAIRVRPYFSALRDDAAPVAGSGAFVVALLATVVFDGFSQTLRFNELKRWFYNHVPGALEHFTLFSTLLMAAIVIVFVLVFLAAMLMVGLREDGFLATASRYAPTLVPIAAVYFSAHYWTYLVFAGQTTLGVLVDPLAHEWNPWGLGEYEVSTTFLPGGLVWWSQIVLIVVGHVAAIIAAHRVALSYHGRARRALRVQFPVVLLMVGYTMAGLWVLAQQLASRG